MCEFEILHTFWAAVSLLKIYTDCEITVLPCCNFCCVFHPGHYQILELRKSFWLGLTWGKTHRWSSLDLPHSEIHSFSPELPQAYFTVIIQLPITI